MTIAKIIDCRRVYCSKQLNRQQGFKLKTWFIIHAKFKISPMIEDTNDLDTRFVRYKNCLGQTIKCRLFVYIIWLLIFTWALMVVLKEMRCYIHVRWLKRSNLFSTTPSVVSKKEKAFRFGRPSSVFVVIM